MDAPGEGVEQMAGTLAPCSCGAGVGAAGNGHLAKACVTESSLWHSCPPCSDNGPRCLGTGMPAAGDPRDRGHRQQGAGGLPPGAVRRCVPRGGKGAGRGQIPRQPGGLQRASQPVPGCMGACWGRPHARCGKGLRSIHLQPPGRGPTCSLAPMLAATPASARRSGQHGGPAHHAGRTKETVREDLLYLSNKYRDSSAILRINGETTGECTQWDDAGNRITWQEEVQVALWLAFC